MLQREALLQKYTEPEQQNLINSQTELADTKSLNDHLTKPGTLNTLLKQLC